MSKKPFSIYLIKNDFSIDDCLRQGHDLEKISAGNLPENSSLFLMDEAPRDPWWKGFLGIEQKVQPVQKGAILFLQVDARLFAVTFGNVWHKLSDHAIIHDFGLLATLNSVEPDALRSADISEPSNSKRRRTQTATATELTYLDFDQDSEIVRSLTGSVREDLKELFKTATGSASFKTSITDKMESLISVCKKLLELYDSKKYEDTFPNVGKVIPVKDPIEVSRLESSLVAALHGKNDNLLLEIPEIIDYHSDKLCCRFRQDGHLSKIYPDVTIDALFEFFGNGIANLTVDDFKNTSLITCDVDGNPGRSYGLFRTLILEHKDGDKVYILNGGSWYCLQEDFVLDTKKYVDSFQKDTDLPPYNHDTTVKGKLTYSEGSYNNDVPEHLARSCCLDKKNISPKGSSQVEPCDILQIKDDGIVLHHIKISTRSASLSHLFAQGIASVELLILNKSSQEALLSLSKEELSEADQAVAMGHITEGNFKVSYDIITHQPNERCSDALPILSLINLRRVLKVFDLHRVPCSVSLVADKSPVKHGHNDRHLVRASVGHDPDGKAVLYPAEGQDGLDHTAIITRASREILELPLGTEIMVTVKIDEHGRASSHHRWHWEPALFE